MLDSNKHLHKTTHDVRNDNLLVVRAYERYKEKLKRAIITVTLMFDTRRIVINNKDTKAVKEKRILPRRLKRKGSQGRKLYMCHLVCRYLTKQSRI